MKIIVVRDSSPQISEVYGVIMRNEEKTIKQQLDDWFALHGEEEELRREWIDHWTGKLDGPTDKERETAEEWIARMLREAS